MNTEFFIAKRIFFDKTLKKKHIGTQFIVKIAIISITISLIVMIFSVAIVTGFKKEIRNKVIGFGSHITITNYDSNSSYETVPISKKQSFYPDISKKQGIRHIQPYAIKAGIIKTDNDIQGIVLKGIDKNFDWSFFKQNLIKGDIISITSDSVNNQVVISNYIAKLLRFEVGDNLYMYFIQNPPRFRKFTVAGIYDTGLEEYDKLFVLADIAHIQKLNNWSENQISGFEILIDNYDELEEMYELVYSITGNIFFDDGGKLRVRTIRESNPQIFDWLDLSDTNVWVILTLMILVAVFNMISGLLILILERTATIGILKSIGMENWSIRKVFIYNAAFIIGKGLIYGNVIGIGLCFIQKELSLISLDPTSYYVSTIPINLKLSHILLLNIGTMIITIIVLIMPTYIITRIRPIKAIRFT